MIINQVGRLCIRYVLCICLYELFICVFSGVLGVGGCGDVDECFVHKM